MNTAVPSRNPASFPIPEFGRSADGLTVARIGNSSAVAGAFPNLCRTGSGPTSMAMVAT
jgi:hypothetical protein